MGEHSTKNPARVCRIDDVFEVNGAPPPDVAEPLAAYLATFAAPVRRDGKTYCLNCDAPIDSMMQALGIGVAFRWDLAYGEARCSGCGWPARGMHRISGKDGSGIATLRNFFLAYHPDQVEQRAALAQREAARG